MSLPSYGTRCPLTAKYANFLISSPGPVALGRPPDVVVAVKALARELAHETGLQTDHCGRERPSTLTYLDSYRFLLANHRFI